MVVSLVVSGIGCKDKPKQHDPRADLRNEVTQTSACDGAEPHGTGALAWFHDDYAAALACAEERELPLIIDMWAPWCHTCLSMKNFVLVDKALAPFADRFVWLAIDTDKEVNATVAGKFPQTAWPTFFAVSPKTEAVQARHVGSASITQFREFIVQAEKNHANDLADRGELTPVANALREADREAIAGRYSEAQGLYREAIDKSPATWNRKPEVLVSLIGAYYKGESWAGCIELANQHMDATGSTASAADFAYYASACAEHVDDAPGNKALREKLLARVMSVVDDDNAPISIDDRSDAMVIVRELHTLLGDEDAAKKIAERQLALLERAASKAPDAFAAMTYNWPRSEVAVYLGRGEQLIAALEKSATALPREYDPPYRLGWIYYKLGKHDLALETTTRALELAYGPRKARVQGLIADIHNARQDVRAEREARAAVIRIYEGLPAGQKSAKAEQQAKDDLEALNKNALEAKDTKKKS